MKRIGRFVLNLLWKAVAGVGKIAKALKEALTIGDAPKNLGITTQTVTAVASAAVPVLLPPQLIEFLGALLKSAVVSPLSWLSQHGLSALGWVSFKLSVAPAVMFGSALATCAISILLLCAIRLVQRLDPRLSPFATFAENLRAAWDWFKSIFAFAT